MCMISMTFGGRGGGGGGGRDDILHIAMQLDKKCTNPHPLLAGVYHKYCVSWPSAMGSIMIGKECITFVWYVYVFVYLVL